MSAPASDKIFLGIGSLLFAGSCLLAFFQQGHVSDLNKPVIVPASGAEFAPQEVQATIGNTRPWPAPKPLSRGSNWVYDVFTPPEIYYNSATRQFTVTPPSINTTVVSTDDFGAELLRIEEVPYRLQLTGYVGTGPKARGSFQNARTGDTLLATSGTMLQDLNIRVESFSVERKEIQQENSTTIIKTVALAKIKDLDSDKELELSSEKRLMLDKAQAVLHVAGRIQDSVLEIGETVNVGFQQWKLININSSAKEVVVTKTNTETGTEETRTLQIAPPVTAPASSKTPVTNTQANPIGDTNW